MQRKNDTYKMDEKDIKGGKGCSENYIEQKLKMQANEMKKKLTQII